MSTKVKVVICCAPIDPALRRAMQDRNPDHKLRPIESSDLAARCDQCSMKVSLSLVAISAVPQRMEYSVMCHDCVFDEESLPT